MTEKPPKVAEWEKSSYSNTASDCVEVHWSLSYVRDSKAPDAGKVSINAAFRRAAKRGTFVASD